MPPSRGDQTSRARPVGAGEGAARVAEQLGLGERLRDRRQLTATNGPVRRPLAPWISRAITSLPVPVSPRISTLASVSAIWSMRSSTSAHGRVIADDGDAGGVAACRPTRT